MSNRTHDGLKIRNVFFVFINKCGGENSIDNAMENREK